MQQQHQYCTFRLAGVARGEALHAREVVARVAEKYGLRVADLRPIIRGRHPFQPVIVEAIRACAEAGFSQSDIADAIGRTVGSVNGTMKLHRIFSRTAKAKPERRAPSHTGEG